MADVIISVVVERLSAIIEEQIRNRVNLVRGVKKEVHNLAQELKSIRKVLDDAERREFKEKSIRDWLKRLEDTSYKMDDVLDEWNIAILSFQHTVCPSILYSCLCFKKVVVRHDIAMKIQNVKAQLDHILGERYRYNFVISPATSIDPSPKSWRVQSTSSIDLTEVYGRERDREILVSKLRPKGDMREELSLHVLAIVGVGGVGKTTLAQVVYNDSRVNEYFELRIWICVLDPFDVVGIVKGIIEGVRKGSCPDTHQLEMLLEYLRDSISGKKFLLVLDDVWTEDHTKWEPLKNSLKCGGAGSKILVTTRNERVAKMMGTLDNDIYRLGLLSDRDCWLLLCRMAFLGRNYEEEFERFQDIGKKIANKCNGLPLVVKVLGGLLRFKNSLKEWENVLNSELWQLEEAEVALFPNLLLSYNELSPSLKRCFSYCAVLPKGSSIIVDKLIEIWMAQGYLGSNLGSAGDDIELKGQGYFRNLAMRSLFQEFNESSDGQIISVKMHDVVHDFAQFMRKGTDYGRVDVAMKNTTCQFCSPLLVSQVKAYRSLFVDRKHPPNLCDCLASMRVLGITRMEGIPQGMENMIHLRWLDLSGSDLSKGGLKIICKLYNLQSLYLNACSLQEIPREMRNLIHLKQLNLSENMYLKKLPDSICDLLELRILDVTGCSSLHELPQGIYTLTNLKILSGTVS